MIKKNIYSLLVGMIVIGFSGAVCARESLDNSLVDFKYEQQDLKDVLNSFAEKKGINVLYGPDPLNVKLTFDTGKKIPLKKAWGLLLQFLDDAGFQLVPEGDCLHKVISKPKAYTEMLPVFVNVHFDSLPDTKQLIRYIYYFGNIDITANQADITKILQNFFNPQVLASAVIFDPTSNGMILTTEAVMVKEIMRLLSTLEEGGIQQQVEICTFKYANAVEVSQILNNLITGTTTSGSSATAKKFVIPNNASKQGTYFSTQTRILPIDPNSKFHINSLIIIGKQAEIDKVVDFIKKYLDVPLQDGKSLFHVVELQWQQANDMAQILNNIKSGGASTSGQSVSTSLGDLAFDPQIQIVPEQTSQGAAATSSSNTSGATQQNVVQRGGNRLVIAATERDWIRLKKIIDDLDIPQRQVVIETMILDLSISYQRTLASQLRTRGFQASIFPKNLQAQANMTFQGVMQQSTAGQAQSLLGDLSTLLDPSSNTGKYFSGNDSGTLFLFSNGAASYGAWGLFQIVSNHSNTKSLARPFVIAQNNKTATVTSSITKRLVDKIQGTVNPKINYVDVPAAVQVQFTPLISSNDIVNLQINIDIVNFAQDLDLTGTRTTRNLQNNVSLKTGDVLILGGLTNETLLSAKQSVPFFEKIPLFGNLVSSRAKNVDKQELFILVRPTIVTPRKAGGMGAVTSDAFAMMNKSMTEFDDDFLTLKDPITHWFFGEGKHDFVKEADMTLNSMVNIVENNTTAGKIEQREEKLDEKEADKIEKHLTKQLSHLSKQVELSMLQDFCDVPQEKRHHYKK